MSCFVQYTTNDVFLAVHVVIAFHANVFPHFPVPPLHFCVAFSMASHFPPLQICVEFLCLAIACSAFSAPPVKPPSRRLRNWSKNENLHTAFVLGAPVGVIPLEFRKDLLRHKTIESLHFLVIGRHCLRNSMFSRFRRTPTCDRRTQRQTDRQTCNCTARHCRVSSAIEESDLYHYILPLMTANNALA